MEHRTDCQLLTVPTYGLCTCDFDVRMASMYPDDGGLGPQIHEYDATFGVADMLRKTFFSKS